jgi:DNA gyrase inhibitor GyrI
MMAAVLFRRNLIPLIPFQSVAFRNRYPKIVKMNEKNRIEPIFLLLFTQLLAQSILQVRRFPFAYTYFSRTNLNSILVVLVEKYD